MTKKFSALLLALLLCSCAIGAGKNSEISKPKSGFFPKVVGIDLQGKERQLPDAFDQTINIVVVAFKREQQRYVDNWIKVVDAIAEKNPEVAFFELPLINQRNFVARSFINNGMHRGVTTEKARARTITVYTNRDKFFKMMKMREDKIYLLVIGRNGKIMQRIEGNATKKNISLLKKKWSF